MFAEYLETIQNFIANFLDPVTNGIVDKVFDFIIELYSKIA